jgi:hypothetical protein
LHRPRLRLPLRLSNAVAGSLAERVIPLDEGSLLAAARKRTGLEDFGDDDFREPLRVFLGALERDTELTPAGRLSVRILVSKLLTTRLRAQELVTRHPEIRELPVRSPIVIVGLPRTGTTHLHNLISCDPALRWLPFWESAEPLRSPRARPWWPDLRVQRTALDLRIGAYVAPLLPLMHEMGAELPHEELQLSAVTFRSFFFEGAYCVPSYRRWYAAADHTDAYRYLRLLLQVLQWTRGGERWVLKSPQHLDQSGPLIAAFPDATALSLATMITYTRRIFHRRVDPVAEARSWVARIEQMLRAALEDEPLLPREQVMDVRFHEFMADPSATLERVFAFSEQPLGESVRRALQAHRAANPRGKHGTVAYSFRDLGLDPDELRERFRFYQERFELPNEPC